MYPTFRDGQIKFVNKLAYRNKEPQRGDIVAVEYLGRQILLLKRVIAVPGERFEVRAGEVYINGNLLEEPYTKGKIPPKEGKGLGHSDPVALGPDEYMILGDNRDLSEGYFYRRKHIIGKIL
jgi:signal peptidase I